MTIIRERDKKGRFADCSADRKTTCLKCGITGENTRILQYGKYIGFCVKCSRHQHYIENKESENAKSKEYYQSQEGHKRMLERQFGGNYYRKISLDGKKCVICDTRHDLMVHHIDTTGLKSVGSYKNSNNSLSNLITMCRGCHTKYHSFVRDNRAESVKKYKRMFNEHQQKIGAV